MNKTILIIFFAIIFILVVLFAFVAGVSFQMKKDAPKLQIGEENAKTVQVLTSRLVHSIYAYGEVKNISGRNITISNGKDDLTVKIRDTASILFYKTTTANPTGAAKEIKFEKIKKGQAININLKLLPNGSTEGTAITIFNEAPIPAVISK